MNISIVGIIKLIIFWYIKSESEVLNPDANSNARGGPKTTQQKKAISKSEPIKIINFWFLDKLLNVKEKLFIFNLNYLLF